MRPFMATILVAPSFKHPVTACVVMPQPALPYLSPGSTPCRAGTSRLQSTMWAFRLTTKQDEVTYQIAQA